MNEVTLKPIESPFKATGNSEYSMSFFKRVRDRFKYRLVWQTVSDLFEWLGITVVPYYMFEESFADKLNQNLDLASKTEPVAAGFLSYSEVERLRLSPEGEDLETEMQKLLGDGCRCFALKQGDEVVSYMLCNFRQCDSRLVSYPMQEDEVYLSGAYTLAAHRGRGLVAVLEHELYKQLNAMGLKKYHSINVLSNTPGLRFKKKLRSKPVRLCLYICLFKKFRRNITLRRYRG